MADVENEIGQIDGENEKLEQEKENDNETVNDLDASEAPKKKKKKKKKKKNGNFSMNEVLLKSEICFSKIVTRCYLDTMYIRLTYH